MLFSQEVFELRERQQFLGYRPGWVWYQLRQRYEWFSLSELELIADVLGYRSGWVYHQLREWGPPPSAPPPIPSKLQQSLKLLGLHLPVDEVALKRAYRGRSLQAHPDAGGTHAAFLALSEAYEYLKGHLAIEVAV